MNRTGAVSLGAVMGSEPSILIGRPSRSYYVYDFGMRPRRQPERGWTRLHSESHGTCTHSSGYDAVPKILWGAERQGQPELILATPRT